jgi:threonine synthase
MTVAGLTCVACGTSYPPGFRPDVCPRHPGLEGILVVEYDLGAAGAAVATSPPEAANTLARYAPLLPLAASSYEWLPTGWITPTPLIEAPLLARELAVRSMAVKDEGRNPTGSLKDRSSTLAALHARELGHQDIVCASTGNAASSLAGICAHVGITAHILVPVGTPTAKLDQLRMFGADVLMVRGSYDDAYDLCREVAEEFGWYDRNCATNPNLVEGKKTCGLELA